MSYPPTADPSRRFLPDDDRFQSRSSADLYASVPTHEAYDGHPTTTPPPQFVDENHYPIRRDSTLGSFGMDDDPYGTRYGSTTASFANFADLDGQSQVGLNTIGRGESYTGQPYGSGGAGGDKYEEEAFNGAGPVLPKQRQLKRGGAAAGSGGFWSRLSSRGRRLLIIGAIVLLILIIIAVAVPAAVVTSQRDDNKSEAVDNSADITSNSIVAPAPSGVPTGDANDKVDWRTAAYGGDGSIVYTEDGTSFQYNNSFGKRPKSIVRCVMSN